MTNILSKINIQIKFGVPTSVVEDYEPNQSPRNLEERTWMHTELFDIEMQIV